MGGEGVRESSVSVFLYLYSPVTTPQTDALYVLTVCRRSFCLFHCVFLLSVVFLHPSFRISPLLWRLPRRSQTTALSLVSSVWWPTLHSLCMEVQQAYMLCVHKLRCKWLEQKGGAAVREWKWKCVPLKGTHCIKRAQCSLNTTTEGLCHWWRLALVGRVYQHVLCACVWIYIHTGHVSIVSLSLTHETELTAPLGPAGSHFFLQVWQVVCKNNPQQHSASSLCLWGWAWEFQTNVHL